MNLELNQLPTWVITAFIILDLALITIIIWWWRDQRKQKQQLQLHLSKNYQYVRESLLTLTRACLQNQCEISEGALRISRMLDFYPQTHLLEKENEIIKEFEERLKGFAILEQRKKLSFRERFKQDKQRLKVEEKFEKVFLEACQKILDHLTK